MLTYRDWIGLLAGSDNMFPKRVFSFISAKKKSDISLLKLYIDQDFSAGLENSFLIKGLLSFLLYVKPLVLPELQRYMCKL